MDRRGQQRDQGYLAQLERVRILDARRTGFRPPNADLYGYALGVGKGFRVIGIRTSNHEHPFFCRRHWYRNYKAQATFNHSDVFCPLRLLFGDCLGVLG